MKGKRHRRIVTVDERRYVIVSEKRAINAVFLFLRPQAEYHINGRKMYVLYGPEKAFDRVSRKVLEWAMRKKGIPEALFRPMMSMYEGAKTRVRVDSEL